MHFTNEMRKTLTYKHSIKTHRPTKSWA